MRFEGTIKSWNDAKGFGFLASARGGQDIFVHVSALPRGTGTPRVGQAFTFEVEVTREGKKRAIRVAHVGQASLARSRAGSPVRDVGSPKVVLVGLLLALAIGAGVYGAASGRFARVGAWGAGASASSVQSSPAEAATLPATFRCDGRTYCSQMTSCAEAQYFLKNCPGVKMDGNGDGVPCEQQWCTSIFSR